MAVDDLDPAVRSSTRSSSQAVICFAEGEACHISVFITRIPGLEIIKNVSILCTTHVKPIFTWSHINNDKTSSYGRSSVA